MAKLTKYTIKNIPLELRQMKIADSKTITDGNPHHEKFKIAVSDWIESEYLNGFEMCGLDFFCNIAIFKEKENPNNG